MTTEAVSVLEQPVEIRGGGPRQSHRGEFARKEASRFVGGYAIELYAFSGGAGFVYLRECGPDKPQSVREFPTADEARAEYARLESHLWACDWVGWVHHDFIFAKLLPPEFLGGVLAGELETLLVAADCQDEHGQTDAAILLRAAYYRIRGEANVAVRAGKGRAIVLNPEPVTKKYPAQPGLGCRAAIIEEGKSIRILKLETGDRSVRNDDGSYRRVPYCEVESRTFGVGSMAEHGSYNLVYFGPVEGITAKTVVIDGGFGHGKKRLTIGAFVAKNHDFDLAKARKRNDEWTD